MFSDSDNPFKNNDIKHFLLQKPLIDSAKNIKQDSSLETLLARIARHMTSGQMDPATLRRGALQVYDSLVLLREGEGSLFFDGKTTNYRGISGLTAVDYTLSVPAVDLFNGFLDKFSHQKVEARIFEFPKDSSVQIDVTPEDQSKYTNAHYLYVPGAIASFTGPTTKVFEQGELPNNGFYSRDMGNLVTFMDTNPSGLRRGAFGLKSCGELVLMDDARKWTVIDSQFEGFDYLVGTSYYMTLTDLPNISEGEAPAIKSHLSYLLQFRQPDGQPVTAFCLVKRMISRDWMRRIIDDYATRGGFDDWMAVELEYSGANCVTIDHKGQKEIYGGSGFIRYDHYTVVRNAT
jgi:hypothetical protein